MRCKSVLYLFGLFFSLHFSAQELTISLSQYSNKRVFIRAVHGIRKDTIGSLLLDKNGYGTLAYTTKQAFTGLVNLTVEGKEHLSFDFVLSPKENPILSCDGEYLHSQNTTLLHTSENDCLNRWFDAVLQYNQKISLNKELSALYAQETVFSKQLKIEKSDTEVLLQKVTDTINHSRLFAAKYMEFKLAQEEKLTKVWESNEQRSIAKNYFVQIDFDALYGSSMWFPIINSCIEAYVKEGAYYQTFGTDVVRNLKRIKNQQVYEDLIDAAISVTEKFSWTKDQEAIVDFIIKDNRIKNPNEKLQKTIQSYNLAIGKKAPNLLLTNPFAANRKTIVLKTSELKSKYTLILFYQSDCGHCKIAAVELTESHQDLVKKGIKILSIAGDLEQKTFEVTASQFPWSEKYCDVNGMNGVNFKNYAIIGTPSIYILDQNGIILGKFAAITEVLDFVNQH